MPKKDIEKVKSEIEELLETISEHDKSEKYAAFARAVIVGHYTSFLAIVWKSFEAGSEVPGLAKFSLLIFAIGGLLATLRFLIDYLSPDNIDAYRRLIEIDEEYGAELKEKDVEGYKELSLMNKAMKWAFKNYDTEKTPSFAFYVIYYAMDVLTLVISFALLLLGLLLLGFSAVF